MHCVSCVEFRECCSPLLKPACNDRGMKNIGIVVGILLGTVLGTAIGSCFSSTVVQASGRADVLLERQVSALESIASELRDMRRDCRR